MAEEINIDTLDTDKKAMLATLEEFYGIVLPAAKKAGICRATHYNWYNTDPIYKAAVDDMSNVALDHVESKLFEKIEGVQVQGKEGVYDVPPSDTALIFYLKTKGKNRGYVERQENRQVDGEGNDVKPIDLVALIQDLSKLK